MKLTKTRLREIIREEIAEAVSMNPFKQIPSVGPPPYGVTGKKFIKSLTSMEKTFTSTDKKLSNQMKTVDDMLNALDPISNDIEPVEAELDNYISYKAKSIIALRNALKLSKKFK